ncbi:MAG: DUF4381 domain-containing protein [Gammaproteobacteria bacterium]|nr:DUF4381 domain-containing protein [Gammaproteobacteria bacterium]MCP4877666.1 DUF4381 domain-containing protein [Gammaproteobacteria bacterium]
MNELELRDIHLPDAGLWWPPAPGWWLALALLVALLLLVPWLVRRIRHKPVKRLCLRELQDIRQKMALGQAKKTVVGDTATLLRRAVMAYRGRSGFAASTGDDWLQQLQNLVPAQRFSQAQLDLLAHHRYRRDFECDLDSLLEACERWIRALPRSRVDVPD